MIPILIVSLIFCLLVVFDALEDAFNRHHETARLGHSFGNAFITLWLVFVVLGVSFAYQQPINSFGEAVGAFLILLFAYIGFRFALFNPVWNKASKQKLNYIGSTSIVDQWEKEYMPLSAFWITRVLSFAFGCLCAYIAIKTYVL